MTNISNRPESELQQMVSKRLRRLANLYFDERVAGKFDAAEKSRLIASQLATILLGLQASDGSLATTSPIKRGKRALDVSDDE